MTFRLFSENFDSRKIPRIVSRKYNNWLSSNKSFFKKSSTNQAYRAIKLMIQQSADRPAPLVIAFAAG
jgi:hypothetical protein